MWACLPRLGVADQFSFLLSYEAVGAGKNSLPAVLRWKDGYLSPDSFVLTLMESLMGPVTVNLAHIPHKLYPIKWTRKFDPCPQNVDTHLTQGVKCASSVLS